MKLKKILWIVFVILAVIIGLYPLSYLLFDMSNGLLGIKNKELLANYLWNISFYTHISFGGIALLIGWTQFAKKFRAKKMRLHRTIGKIYILSILLSGITGLYISYHASGEIASKLGFATLSILWLGSIILAYTSILKKKIEAHRRWMIRTYALTFAAVTLRLWSPILEAVVQPNWIEPYSIVAWLAWVPNLIFAQILIRRTNREDPNIHL